MHNHDAERLHNLLVDQLQVQIACEVAITLYEKRQVSSLAVLSATSRLIRTSEKLREEVVRQNDLRQPRGVNG